MRVTSVRTQLRRRQPWCWITSRRRCRHV